MSIEVSVIVPTYNRPHLLGHCLAALLNQDFDPAAYEIIVVDDAASEKTRRLVEQWPEWAESGPGRAPRLRYIPVAETRGPAAARNRGWRAARGEIIAFTDDDCIPQPGWLQAGVAALDNGILGAAGQIVVPIPEEPTDQELNIARMAHMGFLTANCFYRRQALVEVGGFDERFTQAWREDSDLFFSLLKRYGGDDRFAHAPEAVVIHPPRRPAPWGASLGDQRKSMFNALLYKKHPQLYRTLIQQGPPWHYYHIAAALLAGLASSLIGQIQVMLAAALIWLLLTGRFCWQRLQDTSRSPSHVVEMAVTSAIIPLLSIFWRLYGALKFRVRFF